MKHEPATTSDYVIDIEQPAETARLVEQSKLFSEAMGGLFPEALDLSNVRSVLDVGCGPGEWANAVACDYPRLAVVGVDINKTMISYASAFARVHGRPNTSFEVMVRRIGDEERVQHRLLELMKRSMHTPLTLHLERGRLPEHVEKAA